AWSNRSELDASNQQPASRCERYVIPCRLHTPEARSGGSVRVKGLREVGCVSATRAADERAVEDISELSSNIQVHPFGEPKRPPDVHVLLRTPLLPVIRIISR